MLDTNNNKERIMHAMPRTRTTSKHTKASSQDSCFFSSYYWESFYWLNELLICIKGSLGAVLVPYRVHNVT